MHPIERIILKKQSEKSTKKIVSNIMYVLMRDLNQDYRTIKKMPLCDVIELIKLWNKEQKEIEKEMKKCKRR